MRLELVTPERQLLSQDVTSVMIPGMEGDMTVMGDHAPMVTTLRPGILRVQGEQEQDFMVFGGFAEISGEGTSILAENAVPRSDVTRDMLDGLLAEAQAVLADTPEEGIAAATQRVNDLKDLIARQSH